MSAVRPALKAGLFLACLAALTAYYFSAFPLPHFLAHLNELIVTCLILLSAWGYGHRGMSFLRIRSALSNQESISFSLVLGLGLIGCFMMLGGWLHLWTRASGWGLLAVGCGLSGQALWSVRDTISSLWKDPTLPSHRWIPCLMIYAGVAFSFLLALAPVTYYDSLVYHFAMPSLYVQAHHWVNVRELIYSAFPQQVEMLWTLGLLIGDETVANLIGWTLSCLLLLQVISFGKRFFRPGAGEWAAGLIATMPAFLLLSAGGYIDVGLTLFAFAALYAGLLGTDPSEPGLIVLSGILAGCALGSKYTGAIPLFLTGAFIVWRSKHRWRDGLFYAGFSLVVFSPWLIKNWIFVGNPVFPFFYHWSTGPLNPWLPQAASGYFRGLTEYHPRTLFQLLKVFLEIPLQPLGFGGGADVLGDFGWAPFLWLVPAVWIAEEKPRMVYPLLAFTAAFVIPWGLTRPVLRFLLPLLPVLAVLAGEAWVGGLETQGPVLRWTARGLIGSFIFSGLFIFFSVTSVFAPFAVAVGLEDRDAYLTRKIDYYGAASYINSQTASSARVFIVGDQRGYYYQRPHRVTPVFSQSPLVEWAESARSPAELLAKLKAEGFTHLVINRSEMQRLEGYNFLSFNPKGKRNWELLQNETLRTPLYHDKACDVYAL